MRSTRRSCGSRPTSPPRASASSTRSTRPSLARTRGCRSTARPCCCSAIRRSASSSSSPTRSPASTGRCACWSPRTTTARCGSAGPTSISSPIATSSRTVTPRSRWRAKSPPRSPQPRGSSHEKRPQRQREKLRQPAAPPRRHARLRQWHQPQDQVCRRHLRRSGSASGSTGRRRPDAMTSIAPAIAQQARLPPLRGRLLWVYRLVWLAVLSDAILVHLFLVTGSTMEPAILGLRLAKAVVIFAVATILFRRRQQDPVAALLSLAFLLWTITSSADFAAANAILPQLLDRSRFLLFVLALLLFPDGDARSRTVAFIATASGAVFLVGIVEAVGIASTGWFLPLAIACVLAAVASLISRFRASATEALRQQLKWVALGLVSGLLLILGARAGAWLAADVPQPGR